MCPGDMPRKGPLASYFGLTEDQQPEHVHVTPLIGFHRDSDDFGVRIRVQLGKGQVEGVFESPAIDE